MRDSSKIKVAVSATTRNQLELDIQDYNLKGIGELCNKIIAQYKEFTPMPESKRISRENSELFKNCAPLQFSLHKRNESFANYAISKHVKTATLCRHYFEQYVDMPRGKREMFLKKMELSFIDYAIKESLNVWLEYRGKVQIVAPCFTAFSPSQVRAYLVVCTQDNEFKALRICHIKNVKPEDCNGKKAFHTRTNALYKIAEAYKEHFDPFLCHGKELKVELSSEGIALYNRATTNRPKVLKVPFEVGSRDKFLSSTEDIASALESQRPGVYIFECSPELAKIYFSQFLETAQILSPAELRNYFRQRFLKAARSYGLMDFSTTSKTHKKT